MFAQEERRESDIDRLLASVAPKKVLAELTQRFGPMTDAMERAPESGKQTRVRFWPIPSQNFRIQLFRSDLELPIDMWVYRYDPALPFYEASSEMGVCNSADVMRILRVLDGAPRQLADKPAVIAELEKITGVVARRKGNKFGAWHLRTDSWSLFNNPFSLSSGYCAGENDFEVWFMANERNPREHQSFTQVVAGLKEFGHLPP